MTVQAVLSIPELHTQILTHLSPKALLFAQRVKKTFRATIKSSPTLQEALFFRLKPSNPREGPILYKGPWKETEAWQLIINPFTLADEASARKMHLSSHAGFMPCAKLQGPNARSRPWTLNTEEWQAERPAKGAKYHSDYRGETLGEFMEKILEEGRRESIGFLGFDFKESVWEADGTAEAARGRLWAISGEEYREEAGERPEMEGYDTDYKGETLGEFIDKTLDKGRK
nr:hypothetical protein B0A51_01727 [Rachicladosporium sp. CCFEE 5018]